MMNVPVSYVTALNLRSDENGVTSSGLSLSLNPSNEIDFKKMQ